MNPHLSMRSGNPALSAKTFKNAVSTSDEKMTIEGTVNKTAMSLLLLMAAASYIAFMYLISFIMSIFGSGLSIMNTANTSLFSIGFSVFVVIIASLNLVLDFDFIEEGAEMGAPKYMEWYGAFGLLVTLIWLYLEILRLLAKLQSRRN